MGRPFGCVCLLLLAAACGCQRSGTGTDPFFGQTMIPPPGTGVGGDPYYPGSGPVYPGSPSTMPPTVEFPQPHSGQLQPGQPATQTPQWQQPANGHQPTPPPAGYYQGSSYEQPATEGSALSVMPAGTHPRLQPVPQFDTLPQETARSGDGYLHSPAAGMAVWIDDDPSGQPAVRVAHQEHAGHPLPLASNVRLPGGEPTPAVAPVAAAGSTLTGPVMRRGTIDLADLPPARDQPAPGSGNPAFHAAEPSGSGQADAVVRASTGGGVEPAGYTIESPATRTTLPNRYAHADDYSWLQGKLEYSASRDEWKLRYLPIDGESTDRFGGSVVLSGGELPSDLRAGEYIKVEGRIFDRETDAGRFAPRYSISRVHPVADR